MNGRPMRPLEDRALLAEIARAIVKHPEHVRVEERALDGKLYLHLYVLPMDRGLVIGTKGRTLTVLRQLFSIVGRADGRQVLVELDD
jgi:predicted RNA-binding protein YlqC (UPF0109 family)